MNRPLYLALLPAAALAAGNAAAAPPGLFEICTGKGSAWILLEPGQVDPFGSGQHSGAAGCAHAVWPRSTDLRRGKSAPRP